MLTRLYAPILWRAMKATNPLGNFRFHVSSQIWSHMVLLPAAYCVQCVATPWVCSSTPSRCNRPMRLTTRPTNCEPLSLSSQPCVQLLSYLIRLLLSCALALQDAAAV